MKKAILPILAAVTLSACSTHQMNYATDILLKGSDYDRGIYTPAERKAAEEKQIAEAKKKTDELQTLIADAKKDRDEHQALLKSCKKESTEYLPYPVTEDLITKLKDLPWKDPFSIKLGKVVYHSDYYNCMKKDSDTIAMGKVYAKNGYGAYGPTGFYIYKDGSVDTNEYLLDYVDF